MSCSCSRFQSKTNLVSTSQTPSTADIQKISEDRFIKADGWAIPSTELMRSHQYDTSRIYNENDTLIEIDIELYSSPSKKIYSFDNEKMAGLNDGLAVESITRESFKGHVFAIEITGIFARLDEKSGKPVEYGPATFERFFDSNGDGVFETYIVGGSQMKLPNWAYAAK